MSDVLREYIEYAESCIRQRRFHEALTQWAIIRQKFPENHIGYSRAAWICIELRDFAQAESLCQQGMARIPSAITPFINFAEISMRQRDFSEALKRWTVVREKFPWYYGSYRRAAIAASDLGDLDNAENLCRNGISYLQKISGDIDGIELLNLCLADILAFKGRLDDSVEILQKIYENRIFIDHHYSFFDKLLDILYKTIDFLKKKNLDILKSNSVTFCIYVFLVNSYCIETRKIFTFIYEGRRMGIVGQDNEIYDIIDNTIKIYNINSRFSQLCCMLYGSDKNYIIDKRSEIITKYVLSGDFDLVLHLFVANKCKDREIIFNLISSNTWIIFDEFKFFRFAQFLLYVDQKKADEIILLYLKNKNINISPLLSSPTGLLSHRVASKEYITRYPQTYWRKKNEKLRIAVCISGQLRGYNKCFDSLLNSMDFSRHFVDIYVHTWKNLGRRLPSGVHVDRVFDGNFLDAFKETLGGKDIHTVVYLRYPNFYNLLTSSDSISIEKLKSFYRTENIVLEDDSLFPFSNFSNMKKFFYKKYKCYQLASLKSYDLVVWARPDIFLHTKSEFLLRDIYEKSYNQKSIFINGSYKPHKGFSKGYLLDESIAIGIQDVMEIYSRVYIDMERKYVENKAYGCPQNYIGHITNEYQLFTYGINVEDLKGVNYSFIDPDRISINDIYEALKKDTATRTLTVDDKILLRSCERDLQVLDEQRRD